MVAMPWLLNIEKNGCYANVSIFYKNGLRLSKKEQISGQTW